MSTIQCNWNNEPGNICGREFANDGADLYFHICEVHVGKAPDFLNLKCLWTDCNYIARTRSAMIKHIRAHIPPPPSKPYKCEICADSFKDSVILENHLNDHRNQIDRQKAKISLKRARSNTDKYNLPLNLSRSLPLDSQISRVDKLNRSFSLTHEDTIPSPSSFKLTTVHECESDTSEFSTPVNHLVEKDHFRLEKETSFQFNNPNVHQFRFTQVQESCPTDISTQSNDNRPSPLDMDLDCGTEPKKLLPSVSELIKESNSSPFFNSIFYPSSTFSNYQPSLPPFSPLTDLSNRMLNLSQEDSMCKPNVQLSDSSSIHSSPTLLPSNSSFVRSFKTYTPKQISSNIEQVHSIQCHWNLSSQEHYKSCMQMFPNNEELYAHVCSKHIGNKVAGFVNLACKWKDCTYVAKKRDHIISHVSSHFENFKPFACTHCPHKFRRKQDFNQHLKIHFYNKTN